MLKNILLLLFSFAPLLFPQEIADTADPGPYYSIKNSGNYFYILSGNKILKLLNSEVSPYKFYFVDEIKGSFSSSTLFAVTPEKLFLKNNDSLFIYSIDSSGKFVSYVSRYDEWGVSLVEPANNDFVIKSGSVLKLISSNSDSIYLKVYAISTYSNQQICYPYFFSGRSVYKYVEGFGYYQVYLLPSNVTSFQQNVAVFQNKIAYRTYICLDPNRPPQENDLVIRAVQEPDFPITNFYRRWAELLFIPGRLVRATRIYIELGSYEYTHDFIYTYSGYKVCSDITDSVNFEVFDNYVFRLSVSGIQQKRSPTANFEDLVFYRSIPSGINENNETIRDFILYQNFPNPFNPATTIKYFIKEHTIVSIKIYDVLGNMLQELVNENKAPGEYSIIFDASDFPSGIYFYEMKTPYYTRVNKMLYLK